MKTITKIFNIYNFDELNEKAKEKVLNTERDKLYNEHCNNVDDVIYEFLYNYGVGDAEYNYSLSYSQGDGVCFYNINLFSYTRLTSKDYNTKLNKFEIEALTLLNEKEYKMFLQYLNEGYNIKIVKNSSNYCHAHTCSLEEEYYYSDNEEEEKEINNLIYDLKKKMENIYYNMCYEIERLAYNYIEYISDNEIKEDINYLQSDCGLMFLEDGSYCYEY